MIDALSEAAALLPKPFERGRVHRYAALAYLARVTFQQRNYPLAAQYVGEVMVGSFSLSATPAEFFRNEGNSEEIWAVIHSPQERNGLEGRSGQGVLVYQDTLLRGGFPDIFSPSQLESIEQNQWRAIDLRQTTLSGFSGVDTFSTKYEDPGWADDIPMLRLADMMLIRAEALARTEGVNSESLDLLNAIRRRALRIVDASGTPVPDSEYLIEYQASDFASGEELAEVIVRERRIELLLEGNRFHDLMRLERGVKGYAFDADELRWPIPQSEMDANPNLVQNPGY